MTFGNAVLCRNVAHVKNLACGDGANVISIESHHGKSRSTTGDEFDLKGLSGVVHMYNRANIPSLKTVIR